MATEEAFVVQQTVWQHARACPVLGEIDNAISRGDTSNEGTIIHGRWYILAIFMPQVRHACDLRSDVLQADLRTAKEATAIYTTIRYTP